MSRQIAKLAAPVVAKITSIHPETTLILAGIFALLCWMGYDQMQDEAKTAEVMREINAHVMVRHQPSELQQIEGEGRSPALAEQIALNTEHQQ